MTKRKVLEAPLASLNEGVNFLDSRKIILYVENGSPKRAIKNICKHMGGQFSDYSEKCIKCPHHGWVLDIENLEYQNPKGLSHSSYLECYVNGGIVEIYENEAPSLWENSMEREPLLKKEFGVSYYSHVCVRIGFGEKTFFTDPWLVGPAFTRGWWLIHQPPESWREDIVKSQGIYISHNHSDHLNEWTLREIAAVKNDVKIYIPSFDSSSCFDLCSKCGLTNIEIVPFLSWVRLDSHTRFMILPDGTGRDDSGLLFEYKGHRILSAVDCSNLLSGDLPRDIDLFMSSFAGGATGFPVCWKDLYTEKEISTQVAKNRNFLKISALNSAKKCEAKAYMPYAGFFTEAHPKDLDIKSINIKNSVQVIQEYFLNEAPEMIFHCPSPGDFYDIGEKVSFKGDTNLLYNPESWEFDKYLEHITEHGRQMTEDEVSTYYEKAGFIGELTLHVQECSEDFSETFREYYIDFTSPKLSKDRPDKDQNYLKMKVRRDVYFFVLRNKLSWEEISIGFQGRFYREPNVYNFDFWDHFQNRIDK